MFIKMLILSQQELHKLQAEFYFSFFISSKSRFIILRKSRLSTPKKGILCWPLHVHYLQATTLSLLMQQRLEKKTDSSVHENITILETGEFLSSSYENVHWFFNIVYLLTWWQCPSKWDPAIMQELENRNGLMGNTWGNRAHQ